MLTDDAWQDYRYWQKKDKHGTEQINKLIRNTRRSPLGSIRRS
ncbi:type II toxin-antitoxin system YoeB family toxin [Candidatus Nitrospira nitrosa]